MDKEALHLKLETKAKPHVQRGHEQIPSSISPYLKRKVIQALDEIKAAIPTNLSEYEKVALLYCCIAYEGVYDDQYRRSSYNFVAPLRDRIGVCSGYAQLLTIMIPYVVGCRTYTVSGYSNTRYESISDKEAGHAWNIVCFTDGSVYHLDVTWDLCGGKQSKSPKWLFKSDSEMSRLWSKGLYPAAPKKYTGSRACDPDTLKKLRTLYKSFQHRFQVGMYSLGPSQVS